jgi:hypothetical protein
LILTAQISPSYSAISLYPISTLASGKLIYVSSVLKSPLAFSAPAMNTTPLKAAPFPAGVASFKL